MSEELLARVALTLLLILVAGAVCDLADLLPKGSNGRAVVGLVALVASVGMFLCMLVAIWTVK